MPEENGATKAEQYKNTQIESARESLERYEQAKERLTAFKSTVKQADKDDLKEMFGAVMSDARSHHRDVVEARIRLSEDGEIESMSSVPMSANAYWDGDVDLKFRVSCNSFLSYDDVRTAALHAIQQGIDGAKLNADEMRSTIKHYGGSL
jgi:hypothetical protein